MIIYIVLGILALLGLGYTWVCKKPHGWVEFKTGLVLKVLPPLPENVDMVRLRQNYRDMNLKSAPKVVKENTKDITIPTRHGDVGCRIFMNKNGENRPLIVFFHGGGWCIGDLDTHAEQCHRLRKLSGSTVLSVDYSLAPEHPFPQPFEECTDVVDWLIKQDKLDYGDNSRLVLAGDSAGGNLAIVVTLDQMKKGNGKRIVDVLPIYPAVDCFSEKGGSFTDYADGYLLTKRHMDAFNDGYFTNEEDKRNPMASPIVVEDLSGFPDTFLITAGFDPLRDEGKAFADKLKTQGCNVRYKNYKGAVHGFFGNAAFGKQAIESVTDMGTYIKNKY